MDRIKQPVVVHSTNNFDKLARIRRTRAILFMSIRPAGLAAACALRKANRMHSVYPCYQNYLTSSRAHLREHR